jgi:hypothetical protein
MQLLALDRRDEVVVGQEPDQALTDQAPSAGPSSLADETMLVYALSSVQVRARMIAPSASGDPEKKAVLDEVRRDLRLFERRFPGSDPQWKDVAWCEIYRLERMLAIIEPDDSLTVELTRRLDEADEEKVPSAGRLRKTVEALIQDSVDTSQTPPVLKPGGGARLRSMLLEVIEETQWHLKKKFTSRSIQKTVTYRVILATIGSFLLFIAPYLVIIAKMILEGDGFTVARWVGLPLWTALTAGLFGAFFSRLLYIQAKANVLSLDELKDAREFSSIILRGIVGMTGAAVVYFFLHAKLISGELFPDFQAVGLQQSGPTSADAATSLAMRLIFPNAQLALVVVWSFLAGFSERLVPSILKSTETTLGQVSGRSKAGG